MTRGGTSRYEAAHLPGCAAVVLPLSINVSETLDRAASHSSEVLFNWRKLRVAGSARKADELLSGSAGNAATFS